MAALCGEIVTVIDEWQGQRGAADWVGMVAFVCTRRTGHDPPCEATGHVREGDRVKATWRFVWMTEDGVNGICGVGETETPGSGHLGGGVGGDG